MSKVILVGINSFIGEYFKKLSKNLVIREVSLYDIQPEEIDFKDVDVVLHLSAIVHQSKKIEEKEYFRVNHDLCIRTANWAQKSGVKQFILLSTVKVYGQSTVGSPAWNEDSICLPQDSYGKSKYLAELDLKKIENLDFIVSIVRTPIVFGHGVGGNILKLVKLIELIPILPFKNVDNNRHYTYIENLIGFIDRIIEYKVSGTFITMDDKALSTTELVDYISGPLKKKLILFKLPNFVINACIALRPEIFDRLFRSFYLDNSKTKKILDYSPHYSTMEGLEKMISNYLVEKDHWTCH